ACGRQRRTAQDLRLHLRLARRWLDAQERSQIERHVRDEGDQRVAAGREVQPVDLAAAPVDERPAVRREGGGGEDVHLREVLLVVARQVPAQNPLGAGRQIAQVEPGARVRTAGVD